MVPTIKVLVTFSRFEELQPLDEFSTPPSSPTAAGRESPSVLNPSNSSWFRWMKSPYQHPRFSTGCSTCRIVTNQDPFAIPSDYNGSRLKQRKRKCKKNGNLRKERVRSSDQNLTWVKNKKSGTSYLGLK